MYIGLVTFQFNFMVLSISQIEYPIFKSKLYFTEWDTMLASIAFKNETTTFKLFFFFIRRNLKYNVYT